MARPAYVVLNADGTVARVHSIDIPGAPSQSPQDLESLISIGYVARRETPLEGGRILVVLDRVVP